MRELEVSVLLELARGYKFGIVGDSERHLKPEVSLLLVTAGEDRFSVISCSIDNSGRYLEADEVRTLLEIATEDVFIVVAYSVGDSDRGSKAAEGFAVSFNSNAGCSGNSGLKRSITEDQQKKKETKYHKFLKRHIFAATLVQMIVHPREQKVLLWLPDQHDFLSQVKRFQLPVVSQFGS